MKKYVGTSWKMNKTLSEAQEYMKLFSEKYRKIDTDKLIPFLIPPFINIEMVRREAPAEVWVGAQNVHWKEAGAYTGEISVPMLKEVGVQIVEIGHSERRELFNETDEAVRLKTKQILKHGLTPLVCVGESEISKKQGVSIDFLSHQISQALEGLSTDEIGRVLFAYEPIWAIGEKGKPASCEYIRKIITELKQWLKERYPTVGAQVPILYGGSVNEQNAVEILSLDVCDGLFIGRAAWTATGYLNILEMARKVISEKEG